MYLGIRSVIYPTRDLTASRDWFSALLGVQPYFDEPFYVGFSLGGFELGLDPGADVARGPVSYWGVENVSDSLEALLAAGATDSSGIVDVGEGIRMATVILANGGGVFGIVENPAFALETVPSKGPGK